VFISETWTDEARLVRVQSSLEFQNRWVVPSDNRGGGLVLFWKDTINLIVEDSKRYFIDAWIDKNSDQ